MRRGARPASPAGDTGEVLSVSQALGRAQEALDRGVGTLHVEGEVFEYRGPYRGSGHYYFKLRDDDAQMEVKMWAGVAARALRCELEEGRKVLASGRFDIWPKRGNLSFILDSVEDLGGGDLARRFEELKKRLLAAGLFDPARKRALPERPRRVVLISAVPSAAAEDVLRTWEELATPLHIWLRPSRVQGEGAAGELAAALGEAQRAAPDLILLARGGGSLEDLWAFNEESLVRAVAASRVPVLCAVGHETDFTLCDFAADERAKTPTAGAWRVASGWQEARRRVLEHGEALELAAEEHLAQQRSRLDRLGRNVHGQRPERRLERVGNAIRQMETELVRAAERWLERSRSRAVRSATALQAATPKRRLELLHSRLDGLAARLRAGSPTALLGRGYALVELPGRPGFLRRATDVEKGDAFHVRLAKGSLGARVEEVRPDGEEDAGVAAPG